VGPTARLSHRRSVRGRRSVRVKELLDAIPESPLLVVLVAVVAGLQIGSCN